jgi:hypothetical protein
MRGRITEKTIKSLVKPLRGSKITYDSEVKGFGFRYASTDSASFILNYQINGRERRITIRANRILEVFLTPSSAAAPIYCCAHAASMSRVRGCPLVSHFCPILAS